jgi:vacuolar-type H+-ATPase subunit I/STV1
VLTLFVVSDFKEAIFSIIWGTSFGDPTIRSLFILYLTLPSLSVKRCDISFSSTTLMWVLPPSIEGLTLKNILYPEIFSKRTL